MTKNNVRDKLENLKYTDIYSLILFALYKLMNVPEYAVLSEMVYLLDKNSLMNFLECFGGTTIRIPTSDEMKSVVNALLLYQFINIEDMEMDEALGKLEVTPLEEKKISGVYQQVAEILKNYDFRRN